MNEWQQEQLRGFRGLPGRTLVAATGVEMAFRGGEEADATPPEFAHPALPFRQFMALALKFEDGDVAVVSTHQNDDSWGLHLDFPGRLDLSPWAEPVTPGIYRSRNDGVMPQGLIQKSDVWTGPKGDVQQIQLVVAGTSVFAVAAEVEPTPSGGFDVVRADESVLLFGPNSSDPAQSFFRGLYRRAIDSPERPSGRLELKLATAD